MRDGGVVRTDQVEMKEVASEESDPVVGPLSS